MKSLAKVNLFLHVLGFKPNGYHKLDSLVVFLKDLYDEITIEESKHTEVLFTGSWNKNIPDNNTVSQALKLMQEYLPQHFKVMITKNIPPGAGLGGGSSNAACIINYINEKYALEIPTDQLTKLCLSIGTDVPMFLYSKALYFSELGEITVPLTKQLPPLILMVVYPNRSLNTAQVYKMGLPNVFRETILNPPEDMELEEVRLQEARGKEKSSSASLVKLRAQRRSSKSTSRFLKYDEYECVARSAYSRPAFPTTTKLVEFLKNTRNDLYKNSLSLLPELAELLSELESTAGCLFAQMTGSGSACFGIFDNIKTASLALNTLQKKFTRYSTYISNVQ